jgi:hypothetical protein
MPIANFELLERVLVTNDDGIDAPGLNCGTSCRRYC